MLRVRGPDLIVGKDIEVVAAVQRRLTGASGKGFVAVSRSVDFSRDLLVRFRLKNNSGIYSRYREYHPLS